MQSTVEVKVLGGLHAFRIDSTRSHRVTLQPKRAALLAYLALSKGGGPCSRGSILALFWPELSSHRAGTALRKAIHELRSVLGAQIVQSAGQQYLRLCANSVRCDALEFKEHVKRGAFVAAASSYSGDFLEGYFPQEEGLENWVSEQRHSLREAAYAVTIAVAQTDAKTGSWEAALYWARKAEELSEDQEEAARLIISILHQSGNRSAAISKYNRLSAKLASELEALPSVETQAIARITNAPTRGSRPIASTVDFFRDIVETADDMIFCADEEGFVTYINEGGARLLGLRREAILGRSYLEFVRSDHRGSVMELHLRQVQQQTPSVYCEYPVHRIDSTVVWIGQNGQIIRTAAGVGGIRVIARDITARKLREQVAEKLWSR
jgi:PAS domain S-box-containing protein